jgi:hypothetical protein
LKVALLTTSLSGQITFANLWQPVNFGVARCREAATGNGAADVGAQRRQSIVSGL